MPLEESCNRCTLITRGGKVAYYICRNPESQYYNKGILPAIRAACQAKRLPVKEEPAAPVPEPPNLAQRVLSYTEALIRWTAAGKPERADKEVERIFNECCKRCGWLDPEKQICRGCGCRVAENGLAVLNKIKMATEHCPQELW